MTTYKSVISIVTLDLSVWKNAVFQTDSFLWFKKQQARSDLYIRIRHKRVVL